MLLTSAHVETMRNKGAPIGEERPQIGERSSWLLSQLRSSGSFKAALAEMQPYVDSATYARTQREQQRQIADSAAAAATSSSKLASAAAKVCSPGVSSGDHRAGKLSSTVDPALLKDWNALLEKVDEGLSKLRVIVDSDMRTVRNIKQYVEREGLPNY